MGPLVTGQHLAKVRSYVDLGIEEGAKLVVDGRDLKLQGYENGLFLGSCLFDEVKPDIRIFKEEIFGPMLSVVRAPDFDSATARLLRAMTTGSSPVCAVGAECRSWEKGLWSRADDKARPRNPMTSLHDSLTVIDGLVVSKWSRAVFADMHKGGLTAANCTCSIWEGFADTMRNIAQWKRWFSDHADLITPVRNTGDIGRAKAEGKTGIILGFQNTSAFEDQLGYIQLFKQLGVGVAQITYNTQNFSGAGCYEPRDTGLSGFGYDIVAEMNRVGILCDLSHVGAATSRDVILASQKPVAYTHILPAALKAHPRNKSDDEIRFIVDHGGFVGVTMFPPFLANGNNATIDNYIAAIDYVIGIAGEDNVGIGTDFTQDHDEAFFEYLCHDKGYGWRVTGPLGEVVNPAGIRTIGEFPNLTAAMEKAGWAEPKIRKVIGENWLRLLGQVWGD